MASEDPSALSLDALIDRYIALLDGLDRARSRREVKHWGEAALPFDQEVVRRGIEAQRRMLPYVRDARPRIRLTAAMLCWDLDPAGCRAAIERTANGRGLAGMQAILVMAVINVAGRPFDPDYVLDDEERDARRTGSTVQGAG